MKRLLAAVLVLVAAPAWAGAPTDTRKSEKGLDYLLRVPQDYDRSRGGLLVLSLHGRGEVKENFMRTTLSMKWLDKAIVACPQAPNADKMWSATELEPMGDLLRELQDEFHPARTIVYGFSAGAYFTFNVASRFADRVQGAIPHS